MFLYSKCNYEYSSSSSLRPSRHGTFSQKCVANRNCGIVKLDLKNQELITTFLHPSCLPIHRVTAPDLGPGEEKISALEEVDLVVVVVEAEVVEEALEIEVGEEALAVEVVEEASVAVAAVEEASEGEAEEEAEEVAIEVVVGVVDSEAAAEEHPEVDVEVEAEVDSPEDNNKIEYRVWNPFRSKLAAAILGGVDNIYMKPGSKVLYLGAASGTTVSHVADIVGPEGLVYAVEFSHRSGRDLLNVAKKRTNVIPIIEDARHPHKYRMLIGMVDCVFADVAQPDQARIIALNSHLFLKNGGHFVMSIKANCIDSTAAPEAVFAGEVKKLQAEKMKPQEQITLEPYERDHAVVVGVYRPPPKPAETTPTFKRQFKNR